MLGSSSLCIGKWCSLSRRFRSLTYMLLLCGIILGEVGVILFQPVSDAITLYSDVHKKKTELGQIQRALQDAQHAQALVTQYEQCLPGDLMLPNNMSLYRSQLMSIVQKQAQDVHIQAPDIQLRPCHSGGGNGNELYCGLSLVFNASRLQITQLIQKIIDHPWLVSIDESRLVWDSEGGIQALLHLSFLFPYQGELPRYPLDTYASGLKTEPAAVDLSHLGLGFFIDSKPKVAHQVVVKNDGKVLDNQDGYVFEDWQYNGLMRNTGGLIAHLRSGEHSDIWLHQGAYLIDSQWRLKEISIDAVIFMHEISKRIVRIGYSGEIL